MPYLLAILRVSFPTHEYKSRIINNGEKGARIWNVELVTVWKLKPTVTRSEARACSIRATISTPTIVARTPVVKLCSRGVMGHLSDLRLDCGYNLNS